MSGTLVGELILWLIVAIIVIVVGVYIVNWLYHRSSKEVSFVRTGLLGERVVINGGAFVLPFIHDYTPVNMNVLPMGIVRAKQDAVITRDRMRIDTWASAALSVNPDILVLAHGGPIADPDDADFIMRNTRHCHGFYGASSMERLPVERALTEQVRKFKAIGAR